MDETGIMTQYLACQLDLGGTVDFKHTPDNVKVQYPFERKHVTMLAGGSGITPMIQALHAILGTPDDTTEVTLIYTNKTKKDVICEGLLDTWASVYPDRFHVVHVISRESHALGEKRPSSELGGHIGRQMIEQHSAPPSEDVLIMVCGPPSMYDSLCGPRGNAELIGLLHDMGYTAEQVVKF